MNHSLHLHGIIVIPGTDATTGTDAVGAKHSRNTANASPLQPLPISSSLPYTIPTGTRSGSLSAIVQNFKSVSTRKINALTGASGYPVWQCNYYEHIIRNESKYYRILQYIVNNPTRWSLDREHPDTIIQESEEPWTDIR